MTWRWRIFFSALCTLPICGAEVSGIVELVNSKDPQVRRHKDYSGVVVWLDRIGTSVRLSNSPVVQMVQKEKRFVPHVLAIQVGTSVDFPNVDPIFHNAFSNFSGKPFDVGLYPPGSSRRVRFDREGFVRVFCNIHPTMSAVIAVLKTPYSAVSNKSGRFSITGVPAGEYRL